MAVDTQEPATMRVHEAAHILGIGRNLAYELARRGELPGALYLGRRIVVSRKMLEQYLNGAGLTVRKGASDGSHVSG